jgi:hypothetical protein
MGIIMGCILAVGVCLAFTRPTLTNKKFLSLLMSFFNEATYISSKLWSAI